jgi:hypothetical protein
MDDSHVQITTYNCFKFNCLLILLTFEDNGTKTKEAIYALSYDE